MRKPILVISTLLTGCVGLDADPPVDESIAALVGGTQTGARPEIGQVASPIGWCTATLIAPRYVLTAAHCVGVQPASAVNFVFSDIGGVGRTYPVDRIHKFTREISYYFLGDVVFDTDVALLRLTSPVPRPRRPPRGSRSTLRGTVSRPRCSASAATTGRRARAAA